MVGFSVAEHHFAQQVDVLPDFLLCTDGQMLRELRTRFVDDDLRGVHAQALLDDGDGDKVEMMSECLIHFEQEAVPLVQKFGNAVLVEKGFDTFGKYPSVTDLRRFIQHLHEEFLVLRTLYHDSVFMLFAAFGFCDGLFTGIVQFESPGYDPNFSAAVNISSATTGMTIPPSNVLIVYSLASGGVSVSALFMAGYLPGILTGVAIMIVAAMFAARKGYPVGVRVPFSEATRVFFRAIPSLMLLVIVIGGILAGLFTATEASAIAVLYALILSFIYKELTWAKLPQVLLRSAKTTAIVLLLVATCTGLSWIMSYENIPQTVSAALLSISDNPVVILILINVILLIVGIFMDMTPAVLIFTPIFLPIATGQLGMDPVHFGIMMVLNLCVGLCTPPVGSVLFIGCSVAGTKIDQVIRPLLPMFAAMVIVLFLVAFLPDLSLLIPRLFGL